MALRCTACLHAERVLIDRDMAAGGTVRDVAKRFGLSPAAVHRHRAHLSEGLAIVGVQSPEPEDLVAYLRDIAMKAQRIAEAAEQAGEYGGACMALREQARVIQILMRVAEARAEHERNNVPPWAKLPPAEQVAKIEEAIQKLATMRRQLLPVVAA